MSEFRLPEKKVLVKPIIREGDWLPSGHSGSFLYDQAKIVLQVPLNEVTGKLIDPLTKEEREFFEDKTRSGLDFVPGSLSPYKEKDNFWHDFSVRITKSDSVVKDDTVLLTLDLSKPFDYLQYVILRANAAPGLIVAKSWEERFNRAEYRVALVEEGYSEQEATQKSDMMEKAYKYFGKLKASSEDMYDFLNIYWLEERKALKPAEDAKREWYITEIQKIVDKNVESFIRILDNKELYEVKLLLNRALKTGSVVYRDGVYELPDGKHIGDNFKEAINFLRNDRNQEDRLKIEAQLTVNKKTKKNTEE
jgi:hypothetical protein